MKIRSAVCIVLSLAAGLTGCLTTRDREPSERVLDAIVVSREFEPFGAALTNPWSAGASYERIGNWYLVFEARDGEATARYRLPVSEQQYMMFQEGTDVQITLVGYELRFLRRRP